MIEILRITELGYTGDGVARTDDGRVVFVPGALIGDEIRAKIVEGKKGVFRSNRFEITEPSPDRVVSRCEAKKCGGCALQELSLDAQRSAKHRRIVGNLKRIAQIDISERLAQSEASGDGWAYRHRFRLHTQWSEAKAMWEAGFHERGSHKVLAFRGCPVAWPELNEATLGFLPKLAKLPRVLRIKEIELAYSRKGGGALLLIRSNSASKGWRTHLSDLLGDGILGLTIQTSDDDIHLGQKELAYDHARDDKFELAYSPGTFTQANPSMNDILVQTLLDETKPQKGLRVLELHAGIGNFSLPMAEAGAEVVATESWEPSSKMCKSNAERAGLEMKTHSLRDVDALKIADAYDLLLLDPPRTGALEVARAIAHNGGPQKIAYISCDSSTFARDLKILGEVGYSLKSMCFFDIFPQTPHTETLAILER